MKIDKVIAHRTNYGQPRSTFQIKYIVIHYTANDGDKAWNNAKYFQTHANLKASAHYFVDDNTVYQSVEDNYIAYSVGGNKWADCSKTGGGKFYNKATNSNTLNIELCDTVRNGAIYPTQATINLAIELTQMLMKKYDIPAENVIRHFDVNGKHCPAYWMDNTKWAREFHSKLVVPVAQNSNSAVAVYRVRQSWGDSRTQVGAFADLENAKKCANEHLGYSVYDANGNCIYTKAEKKGYQGGFPIIPPTLIKGSQGLQVVRLQKFLNWYFNRKVLNGQSLQEDGAFGQKTKSAVLKYQQEVFPNDKSQWDGKFGPKSLIKAKAVKK